MHLLCHSCTPKQIDLQAFFVTTATLLCQRVLLISRCKSAAVQYNTSVLLFGASTKYFNKTNLELCKLLFIVHGRVKAFKTYTGVQNGMPQLKKCAWHIHNEIS